MRKYDPSTRPGWGDGADPGDGGESRGPGMGGWPVSPGCVSMAQARNPKQSHLGNILGATWGELALSGGELALSSGALALSDAI